METGSGEIKGRGGENRQGGGCEKDRAGRARQGVSEYIFGARDVDNVTGELGNISEMARLLGRPWQRGSKKGECEGFMIGEKGEFKGFKKETKMAD